MKGYDTPGSISPPAYTYLLDGVIGFPWFAILINQEDCLINANTQTPYTPQDFEQSSIGYTFTIWDEDKNFLGKWKYHNCTGQEIQSNPVQNPAF